MLLSLFRKSWWLFYFQGYSQDLPNERVLEQRCQCCQKIQGIRMISFSVSSDMSYSQSQNLMQRSISAAVGPVGNSRDFRGWLSMQRMNYPREPMYYLTDARLVLIPFTFLDFFGDFWGSSPFLMYTLSWRNRRLLEAMSCSRQVISCARIDWEISWQTISLSTSSLINLNSMLVGSFSSSSDEHQDSSLESYFYKLLRSLLRAGEASESESSSLPMRFQSGCRGQLFSSKSLFLSFQTVIKVWIESTQGHQSWRATSSTNFAIALGLKILAWGFTGSGTYCPIGFDSTEDSLLCQCLGFSLRELADRYNGELVALLKLWGELELLSEAPCFFL